MESIRLFTVKISSFGILFLCVLQSVLGNPAYSATDLSFNSSLNSTDYRSIQDVSDSLNCIHQEYSLKSVKLRENNDVYLIEKNITIPPTEYEWKGGKIFICSYFVMIRSENITLNCIGKFEYDSSVYKIFPNGSVLLHKEFIIPRKDYQFVGSELRICIQGDYDDDDYIDEDSRNLTLQQIKIYIGKVGSGISIVALIFHLLSFCFLPNLRNLPGYNLASLSVAFLLAYSFYLIGQIKSVLGVYCYISAVLQQNFFLAAFFCMNVLAFDVWRTLKLATEKLVVGSQISRKRHFIWYSLYAWGFPILICTISVIVDNCGNVPDDIKPYYGKDKYCWMNGQIAKRIFFVAPVFTLVVINAFFFIRSFILISSNAMKITNDNNRQTVKLNYVLYVRLGIMMGLTWLIGIIASIVDTEIVWIIFDGLNSLQGLFLFLLFTCTRKIYRQFKQRTSTKSSSEKRTTLSNNSSFFNSKPYGSN